MISRSLTHESGPSVGDLVVGFSGSFSAQTSLLRGMATSGSLRSVVARLTCTALPRVMTFEATNISLNLVPVPVRCLPVRHGLFRGFPQSKTQSRYYSTSEGSNKQKDNSKTYGDDPVAEFNEELEVVSHASCPPSSLKFWHL